MPQEAVLHRQIDGAAKRIEAEDRIIGEDVGAINGLRRDQIPVHRIAESFVDAHAVFIDSDALRPAFDRRSNEAAIIELLREIIAVGVDRNGAGDMLLQRIGHIRRIGPGEIGGAHGLHEGRHFIALDGAAAWRRCDNFDFLQFDRRGGGGGRRGLLREQRRSRQRDKTG